MLELQTTEQPGTICLKLTMLLDNNSLKFQMAILQIHCYFCGRNVHCTAKGSHIFFSMKHNSVFAFEIDILLTS